MPTQEIFCTIVDDNLRARVCAVVCSNLPEHNHDDRYYTETEIDSLLNAKADSNHTHEISDISYLEASLTFLQGGADARQETSEKNQPNGYAGLDENGDILEESMPSAFATLQNNVAQNTSDIEDNTQSITDLQSVVGDLQDNAPSSDTFTPIVTLVGGTGNNVPAYTVNKGNYLVIGDWVYDEIILSGDAGQDGTGSGQIHITLSHRVAADATYELELPIGRLQAASSKTFIMGHIEDGATTVALYLEGTQNYLKQIADGADQNQSSRSIQIGIRYRKQ